MSWAQPGLAWLSALAALVPLVHLVSRFLGRRRLYPWTELLAQASLAQRAPRVLREILLVALRTSAAALVLLIPAGPRWGSAEPVYVDGSGSMRGWSLEGIEGNWVPRRGYGRLNPAQLEGKRGYLITDLQANTFRGTSLKGLTPVVPGKPGPNAQVEAWLASAESVVAVVRNLSNKPQRRVLSLHQASEKIYQLPVQLRPWSEETVALKFPEPPSESWGAVVLEPGDWLGWDDTFYLALPGVKLRVWLGFQDPFVEAALFPEGVSLYREDPEGLLVDTSVVPGRRGVAFAPSFAPLGPHPDTLSVDGKAVVGSWFERGEPLLRSDDGKPVAVLWGGWAIVGFYPTPDSAELVLSGKFPLFLYSWLQAVAGAPKISQAQVDKPLRWRGERLVGPEGTTRAKPFTPRVPGVYRAYAGDSLIEVFAVNAPRAEGDLRPLPDSEVVQVFASPPLSLEEFLKRRRVVDLRPWLLLLAALLLLCEAFLARGNKP